MFISGPVDDEVPGEGSTQADAAAVLAVLANSRFMVLKLATVARWLGVDPPALDGPVAELVRDGLAELWERPSGRPALVLSSLAAERLGLYAIEHDDRGARWVRRGRRIKDLHITPHRPLPGGIRVFSDATLSDDQADMGLGVGSQPDPKAVAPLDQAEEAEVVEVWARAQAAGARSDEALIRPLPRPTVILGERQRWDGPAMPDGPCPGCGGEQLRGNRYCLSCDSWGLAFLIPRYHRASMPRPTERRQKVRKQPARKPRGGLQLKDPAPQHHSCQSDGDGG